MFVKQIPAPSVGDWSIVVVSDVDKISRSQLFHIVLDNQKQFSFREHL